MDHGCHKIEYAPVKGSRSSFATLSTKFVYGTFAIVLAFVLWSFWPRLVKEGQKFSVERRCLNYEAPARQVVYDSDPTRAQVLLSQNSGYITDRDGAAFYTPDCWIDWTRPPRENVLLFLHSMPSKNGKRLVAVELERGKSDFVLYTRLYECNALTISRPFDTLHTFPISSQKSPSLRLYAGHVDPADASRFSIPYTLNGRDGTIHGRLSELGDSVSFEFSTLAEIK
jgi:hypothetical protein